MGSEGMRHKPLLGEDVVQSVAGHCRRPAKWDRAWGGGGGLKGGRNAHVMLMKCTDSGITGSSSIV